MLDDYTTKCFETQISARFENFETDIYNLFDFLQEDLSRLKEYLHKMQTMENDEDQKSCKDNRSRGLEF